MASRELKPGIRPFGLGVITCVLIIGQVGAVALEEAWEVCHCDSVKRVVDCNNNRLTELPIGIPDDTVTLLLNGNFLRKIPEDWLLQFYQLENLVLSSNLISEPFAVPSSLRVLYADDNQLEDIGLIMKTGYGLENVTFVRNKLEVIRPDTFGNCSNLQILFLYSNLISEPFAVPSSLRFLDASDNQLKDIGLIMKIGYGLVNVSFDKNKLEVIQPDTFGNCSNLNKLILSSNQISEPFAVPSSLRGLTKEEPELLPRRSTRIRKPVERLMYDYLGQTKQHIIRDEDEVKQLQSKLLAGKKLLAKWKSPQMTARRKMASMRFFLQEHI